MPEPTDLELILDALKIKLYIVHELGSIEIRNPHYAGNDLWLKLVMKSDGTGHQVGHWDFIIPPQESQSEKVEDGTMDIKYAISVQGSLAFSCTGHRAPPPPKGVWKVGSWPSVVGMVGPAPA